MNTTYIDQKLQKSLENVTSSRGSNTVIGIDMNHMSVYPFQVPDTTLMKLIEIFVTKSDQHEPDIYLFIMNRKKKEFAILHYEKNNLLCINAVLYDNGGIYEHSATNALITHIIRTTRETFGKRKITARAAAFVDQSAPFEVMRDINDLIAMVCRRDHKQPLHVAQIYATIKNLAHNMKRYSANSVPKV